MCARIRLPIIELYRRVYNCLVLYQLPLLDYLSGEATHLHDMTFSDAAHFHYSQINNVIDHMILFDNGDDIHQICITFVYWLLL